MDGAADPRIVERLLLVVHPGALDDALVEVRRRHALGFLRLARSDRVADAGIVDAVAEDRRAEFRRKRQDVKEFDAVEVRQPLVPVVRVLFHHPDLVLDPALALERSGAGNVDDAAQVALIVVQRLLAHDAVPAAGEGRHHEAGGPRLGQLEHHRLLVGRRDLADGRKQRAARDHHAGRRLADAVVGRLHVLRREVRAVVELHALAQVESVGLAVLGDLPAVRQVGNDGLARIARVAPHQVVEHAALAAQAVDRARLMKVEMRRARGDGVFQDAARLRIGLGCLELEFRAVELVGHTLRQGLPRHAEHGRAQRGRALHEFTTVYAGTLLAVVHDASSHLVFCRPRTMCCDGLSIIVDQN